MKGSFALLVLPLALASYACASVGAIGTSPPPPDAVTPAAPSEFVPTALPITPTFEGCAYVWGSQDMPEVSRALNAELQKISTDVSGLAYAYGENCVYADGHQTFGAMETDFRVGVQVRSVKDDAALGGWISRVMPIVLALPKDQLQGPQTGRVDFDFKSPDPGGEVFVTVPINKYLTEATGLKGADLLHLFYTNP